MKPSTKMSQNCPSYLFLLPIFLILLSCRENTISDIKPPAQSIVDKEVRTLKEVNLSGSGYDLGFQHGKKLKNEISEIVKKWKDNTASTLGVDADVVLSDFLEYASFDDAIKKWTPDLYEEIRGIADGSEQDFNDIYVLNLLDEFWVYIDNPENHHCSDLGVPAHLGRPTVVAQNMDIESYTDGYQTLIFKDRTEKAPAQMIITHPGLIALNGLNVNGVGTVVNTIMQLKASNTGLPVAFVVRKILSMSDQEEILDFITSVPHASGQSYIIGIGDEVYNFEASAGSVVPHDPGNENGSVYHTNHPIINENLKTWHIQFNPKAESNDLPVNSNSYIRLSSVSSRIAEEEDISIEDIKETLTSKDDPNNPVCRTWSPRSGFTFASTIMILGENPRLQVTAGPPDESDYASFSFK